jgi:hypothetical protein
MDPNETLKKMLSLATDIQTAVDALDEDDLDEPDLRAADLASAVQDLHTWIQKGGSLPSAWQTCTVCGLIGGGHTCCPPEED